MRIPCRLPTTYHSRLNQTNRISLKSNLTFQQIAVIWHLPCTYHDNPNQSHDARSNVKLNQPVHLIKPRPPHWFRCTSLSKHHMHINKSINYGISLKPCSFAQMASYMYIANNAFLTQSNCWMSEVNKPT